MENVQFGIISEKAVPVSKLRTVKANINPRTTIPHMTLTSLWSSFLVLHSNRAICIWRHRRAPSCVVLVSAKHCHVQSSPVHAGQGGQTLRCHTAGLARPGCKLARLTQAGSANAHWPAQRSCARCCDVICIWSIPHRLNVMEMWPFVTVTCIRSIIPCFPCIISSSRIPARRGGSWYERCTPFTVPVPEAYVQQVSEARSGAGDCRTRSKLWLEPCRA